LFLFFVIFFYFFQFSSCGEAFQHPMDHVHIAIVLNTMLEIVLLLDNFLIILMSIWTHCSLDRGMTLTLIPITQHGATSLISRGKLKLLKIMLYKFMNSTIRHIRSLMGNHIPLNIKQLHNSNLRPHHLLSQILTFKISCRNLWARWIKHWTLSIRQWTLTLNLLPR
jgi:hypothetical protein